MFCHQRGWADRIVEQSRARLSERERLIITKEVCDFRHLRHVSPWPATALAFMLTI